MFATSEWCGKIEVSREDISKRATEREIGSAESVLEVNQRRKWETRLCFRAERWTSVYEVKCVAINFTYCHYRARELFIQTPDASEDKVQGQRSCLNPQVRDGVNWCVYVYVCVFEGKREWKDSEADHGDKRTSSASSLLFFFSLFISVPFLWGVGVQEDL